MSSTPVAAATPPTNPFLAPQICLRLAYFTSFGDLPSLALTCRTLQPYAETRLYASVEFYHSTLALRVCKVLIGTERLARKVRTLLLVPDNQHHPHHHHHQHNGHNRRLPPPIWANADYWAIVSETLRHLPCLTNLTLSDPSSVNRTILDSSPPFSLTDARLALPWTPSLAAFLSTQHDLRDLYYNDVVSKEALRDAVLDRGALRGLKAWEGPVSVWEMVRSVGGAKGLEQVKLIVDMEVKSNANLQRGDVGAANGGEEDIRIPRALSHLRGLANLRSLSIVTVPEHRSVACMQAIAAACPQIRYLAHFPLPSEHIPRLKFLTALTSLPTLHVLELDISHWTPKPQGPFQRMFAVEAKMACAPLKSVVFWVGGERCLWEWVGGEVVEGGDAVDVVEGGAGGAGGGERGDRDKEMRDAERGGSGAGGGSATSTPQKPPPPKNSQSPQSTRKTKRVITTDGSIESWRTSASQHYWPVQSVVWRNY
ncbi:hypothetical protein BD410DRAFT_830974 [Rickenella mellea]|uniref:F-box domain-containing protein n=1 Tax=Rickenella mellea TaxID=50990 RepID=A0A4Y7PSH3_9AGAM|nr:hypothetical protein BD410DRAFT_830974 [Rickenella mellea]